MRKYILSLIFPIAFISLVSAQTVYIPDSHFLGALKMLGVDKNKNELIEVSEALACDTLQVNTTFGITDLTGIEAFANLKLLNCTQNQITILNVSKNTQLVYLGFGFNKIKDVDLSHNPELIELECLQNNFTILDLSKNPKLKRLRALYCNLTTINLLNNLDLEYLDIGGAKLTDLHVSRNSKLTFLDVTGNTSLSSICVFDTIYAKSNPKFKKDPTQTWTQNCIITSFEELSNTSTIEVYPNPASENLKISGEVKEVKIYNANGTMLLNGHSNNFQISRLPKGIYQVHIVLPGGQSHFRKFVKE